MILYYIVQNYITTAHIHMHLLVEVTNINQ